jgi:ribonuclease HI
MAASAATVNRPPLRFIQVNLGRCRRALDLLLAQPNFDVALLSEPPTHFGSIGPTPNYQCLQSPSVGRHTKSAILVSDKLNCIKLSAFSDANNVFADVGDRRRKILVGALYYEPDGVISDQLRKLSEFLSEHSDAHILVGGDLNGHSSAWNSPDNNDRGDAICDALSGLHILNNGSAPTFEAMRSGREVSSIVDITAATSGIVGRVGNSWRVSDEVTLSDHRAIRFQLSERSDVGRSDQSETFRPPYNMKKCDWGNFEAVLSEHLRRLPPTTFSDATSGSDLDELVGKWISATHAALDESAPLRGSGARQCAWWSEDLASKKQEARRHSRAWRCATTPTLKRNAHERKKEADKALKAAIAAAKKVSFKALIAATTPTTAWSTLSRILFADRRRPPTTLVVGGVPTTNASETTAALARQFFPSDTTRDEIHAHRQMRGRRWDPSEVSDDPPFTVGEIVAAAQSFNPTKAPGSDNITADANRKCIELRSDIAEALFNACLRVGHFPTLWKSATIRCIPKPDKPDYSAPKAYRPIGLLSIPGKTLEKVMVRRLEWHIAKAGMAHPSQDGFTPQRSINDTLRKVKTFIEGVWADKTFGVIFSLDIEGAFDTAWWPFILSELRRAKIPRNLFALFSDYLVGRTATLTVGDASETVPITQGAIQGSIVGPCAFKLIVGALLRERLSDGCALDFYADDANLRVRAPTLSELELRSNDALEIISDWGRRAKLRFGAAKTQAMLVTRRLNQREPSFVMSGAQLPLSKKIKLLGVTIDNRLTFSDHVSDICDKVRRRSTMLARAACPTWGASSEVLRLLVTGAMVPMALSGAAIWGEKLAQSHLDKLNSAFLPSVRRVVKGYRTISATAAFALSEIIPIDLQVAELCAIDRVKRGVGISDAIGSNAIGAPTPPVGLSDAIGAPTPPVGTSDIEFQRRRHPFALPHPARRHQVRAIETELAANVSETPPNTMDIYTDGSRDDDANVGAGFVAYRADGREKCARQLKLHSVCTVYQAECFAALQAVRWFKDKLSPRHLRLFSDSQSMCRALSEHAPTDPMIADIQAALSDISDQGRTSEIHWIRGHQGLLGNDRADELAKAAALSEAPPMVSDFPLSYAKRLIRDNTRLRWSERYKSATTGAVFRKFFPTPSDVSDALSDHPTTFYLSQMLIGHGANASYLARFKLRSSAACECGCDAQTTAHLIDDCPIFEARRVRIRALWQREWPAPWSELLRDHDCRLPFLAFVEAVGKRIFEMHSTRLVGATARR